MSETVGAGYLARVEANRIAIRPGPNVVYLRLIRDFAGEGQSTTMFSELSPGATTELIRELQAALDVALQRAEVAPARL